MLEISRREMLKTTSCGFGYLAFSALATEAAAKEYKSPLAPKPPQFTPRAKRVIFLCMRGGPSHVDTFDHKPLLAKHAGQTPGKVAGVNVQRGRKLMPSPWKFPRRGDSGLPISELFPCVARHADQMCLINGAHTDNPAHPQATIMWHTGSINFVRPSIGAWVVYGLGTENQNLPGFITINPPQNLGGAQNYGSSFLPAAYQGTSVAAGANAVAHLRNPNFTRKQQRRHLNLIQSLNRGMLKRENQNSELEGIIESYELAFRMQSAVPELMDISTESQAVREMYGIGSKETDNFGKQCLMARRLAEGGVRFIEIAHRGWDQHNNLKTRLAANCRATDQPIGALMTDLKARGMLEDTLLVWSGEFGRTPAEQNNFNGRRHNNRGFTVWMAGGGVQGGQRYGATDPTGDTAVVNKAHTHDIHATILHLLGLDHQQLTYRYSGRDFRLTDVYGNVLHDVIS